MTYVPTAGTGGEPLRARLPWPAAQSEARALVRLAIPIAGNALVNMAMSLTDIVMIGWLFGTGALAATAVGSDLYSILLYLGFGIIGGLSPFVAGAVARGDADTLAGLWRSGCWIVALSACAFCPLVWFGPDYLGGAGIDAELLAEGRGYTRAMALTLVPMFVVTLFRIVLIAAERPRVFLRVTLAMVPLNALFNAAFMVGTDLGPAGAGVSSLLVSCLTAAALVVVVRRSGSLKRAGVMRERWIDPAQLLAVLRVGIPIGIATLAEVGVFLGATLYAARFGAAEVAAHTIALRLTALVYAVPAALLQAAMVRTARAEATGTGAERRLVVATALLIGGTAGLAIAVTLAGLAGPLSGLLDDGTTTGAAAAATVSGLILLLALIELVEVPGNAATGILRGRKQTRAPMIYVLAGYWGIGAPVALVLAERGGLGATGIWIGLTAGAVASGLAPLFHVLRRRNS